MRGHRVVLLERQRFPRYQIGESLLPSTIHGICRMLGVYEEVEKAGFMRKAGGTFRWGKQPDPWTFAFAAGPEPLKSTAGYAYQVERSKFDALLLDNAKRKGVDVREQCSASELVREGGRVARVRYTDDTGGERGIRTRFVVDASGNQSRFYNLVGERVYSKLFQNVAMFGYFKNGKRLPAPNQGNILCAAFELGWFWYIPLTAELTSVGAVIAREHANKIQGDPEAGLLRLIQACPLVRDFLAEATRVTEGQYGQVRVRKDYSYCNTQFSAPGLALVGDSACFIDPVFSSGVHLATYSGVLAARSINSCLEGSVDETRAMEEFERRYRLEFGVYYDFLMAFYDMEQGTDSYFWQARRVLHTEEKQNDAFIRLVAGVATAPADFFAMRQDLGASFATVVEGLNEATSLGKEAVEQAMHKIRVDEQIFQWSNLIHQGLEGVPPVEAPSSSNALVPSPDGLSWSIVPSVQPREAV
ncbi:tryptophan 7-halogenase [Pendulispora albinea]|uniref:Tryptophan 7-halogenase n=2 Tax=Pendulispora albinea TaxID=2741071 RepID=A0ABZ2MCN0_9BACT